VPLFQLLPIIGFVAPPLSKSRVVVTVSNATRAPIRENTGGIDLAMYGEACGVSIHEYTLVFRYLLWYLCISSVSPVWAVVYVVMFVQT